MLSKFLLFQKLDDNKSINQIENAKQNPKSYTLYKILYSLGIDFLENFTLYKK